MSTDETKYKRIVNSILDDDNDDEVQPPSPPPKRCKKDAPVDEPLLPLGTLLTHRDLRMESFLQEMLGEVVEGSRHALPDLSSDEITRLWTRELASRVSGMSAILWTKLAPTAGVLIAQRLKEAHDETMVSLVRTPEPMSLMGLKYRTLFNQWVNAEQCVSFGTLNTVALGGLAPRDYFVLQFFVLGTCQRSKADNLLQIAVSGETTVGKSTLFEAPLTGSAHYYVGDAGVGRFRIDDKTILFFHDVDVNDLVFGRDRDLIKTVARGEATQAKVHGSVVAVPPVHVFYTSNTRLMTHRLPYRAPAPLLGSTPEGVAVRRLLACGTTSQATSQAVYKSDVVGRGSSSKTPSPGDEAHLRAMRHRFLECFCAEKPPIDTSLLPRNGSFHRNHMILGLYERVVELLERVYTPDHFQQMPALADYVVTGLAKHVHLFCQHLLQPASDKSSFLERILALSERYVLPKSSQQHDFIVNLLSCEK